MKTKYILGLTLALTSLTAMAEKLTCHRVIEASDRPNFIYVLAPKVPTRVPVITFDTETKMVSWKRLRTDGSFHKDKGPYTMVPPSEEFEGNSLGFKSEVGEAMLNFAETHRGKFSGSAEEFLIGEFFEGDFDSTSWSYLCPLSLDSEVHP